MSAKIKAEIVLWIAAFLVVLIFVGNVYLAVRAQGEREAIEAIQSKGQRL